MQPVLMTGSSSILSLLIIVLPLALMYVILIVPQPEEKKMRNLINRTIVGDEIMCISGLCSKIVNIKDDEVANPA